MKVLNCVQKLIEVVVLNRDCFPISSYQKKESTSVEDYAKQYTRDHIMRYWKHDLYSTFCLNIYLREPNGGTNVVLLEKWTFQCLRGGGNEQVSRTSLSRRFGILIRSLYCYVRLLPIFHSSKVGSASLMFKIENTRLKGSEVSEAESLLTNEFLFPRLPSPALGFLTVKVAYVSSEQMKIAPRFDVSLLNAAVGPQQVDSPTRNTSLPMPIPDAKVTRDRSISGSGPSMQPKQSRSSGERSRSSDSSPLYLQETPNSAYMGERRDTEYAPSSVSPAGMTPPFSAGAHDYLFSRTPEGYTSTVALAGSAPRRDSLPPLCPVFNLLSTSPQFSTMVDISAVRNKFLNSVSLSNQPLELNPKYLVRSVIYTTRDFL